MRTTIERRRKKRSQRRNPATLYASNAYGRIKLMTVKFLRLLVALALALAIPLQGAASVTAGICMATGHHDAGSPASHDHGGNVTSHHHDGDADHPSAPPDDGPDAAHCAPCVACCAAASIAPAVQVFLFEDSPAAAVAALPYLHPGFLPEKLDRPPLAL